MGERGGWERGEEGRGGGAVIRHERMSACICRHMRLHVIAIRN